MKLKITPTVAFSDIYNFFLNTSYNVYFTSATELGQGLTGNNTDSLFTVCHKDYPDMHRPVNIGDTIELKEGEFYIYNTDSIDNKQHYWMVTLQDREINIHSGTDDGVPYNYFTNCDETQFISTKEKYMPKRYLANLEKITRKKVYALSYMGYMTKAEFLE